MFSILGVYYYTGEHKIRVTSKEIVLLQWNHTYFYITYITDFSKKQHGRFNFRKKQKLYLLAFDRFDFSKRFVVNK